MEELRENPGTPFRPPAVAVMTIDSRDRIRVDPTTGYRTDTTTPYQILINKGQSVMNGFFTRIGLTEINMQWDTPNVIATGPCQNNTLLLEEGAAAGVSTVVASYVLRVTEGFYTPNELAKAIQATLIADVVFGTANWQCVYDERNNGFVIRDVLESVVFRIRPQNIGAADDLCNLMGYTVPSQQFTGSVVSSYASMIYTPYFDIVSNNLTKKQNVRDNGTSFLTGQNLLARVYLTPIGTNVQRERTDVTPANPSADTNILGCRPFTLYREYNVPKQIYWDAQEFINVIDLQLVDYKGRTLYSRPQLPLILEDPAQTISFSGEAANYQLTLQVTET
jgi:hypothetical protein